MRRTLAVLAVLAIVGGSAATIDTFAGGIAGERHVSGALSVRSGSLWECKLVNPRDEAYMARLDLIDMNGNTTISTGDVLVPAESFITLSQFAFGASMRYCRGRYRPFMRGTLNAVDSARQTTASSIMLMPDNPRPPRKECACLCEVDCEEWAIECE